MSDPDPKALLEKFRRFHEEPGVPLVDSLKKIRVVCRREDREKFLEAGVLEECLEHDGPS